VTPPSVTPPSVPPESVTARRAVEALRAGVPSRDAVRALGTPQRDIEDAVAAVLARVSWPTSHPRRSQQRGVLLGGGFGSGKSHLLEHLAHLAGDSNWIVSRVAISKETPLYDPGKVLRASVEGARAPSGGLGGAIADVLADLDLEGRPYVELLHWASSDASGLDERFPASLALYAKLRDDSSPVADAIVRFWSGDPLRVTELRRWIKDAGSVPPRLGSVPVRELARQRLRFLARLFAAAGRSGWLVLLDEVELIGRYGPLSRARSYAELDWWLRGNTEDSDVPLTCVVAMTDDYASFVLTDKDDRTQLPHRLRDRHSTDYDRLASQAEAGMGLIDREMLRLQMPDPAELDAVYEQLERLHGQAFGWHPPEVGGLERLGTTQMRQYVRAWINEWDLIRLDPEFAPDTTVVATASEYTEDSDLGGSADDDQIADMELDETGP
jgi:hypothetical protein